MNIKKSLLVAGAVTSVGLAGATGVGIASAATSSTSDSSSSNLVDKIASTFGLDKTKVQAVFDSERQQKEAEHQAQIEKELSQLVTDGKITEAQKTTIIAKQKELRTARETNRDTMKDKTGTERKAYMEQQRTALEKWATDNGISTEYLRYVMGGGHRMHGGPGRPMDAPGSMSVGGDVPQ